MREYISDVSEYLNRKYPALHFVKRASYIIDDEKVPAYVIKEYNGCALNAAACMIASKLGSPAEFDSILDECREIAKKRYSRQVKGATNFYVRLGSTAHLLNDCAAVFGIKEKGRSRLRTRRRTVSEILNGRPVMLNIGISSQYYDHTIVAYGFEEYVARENGMRLLFFKVRDGYSTEPRYLRYRWIFGIFVTTLRI